MQKCPGGGHEICPVVATRPVWLGQGDHSFAGPSLERAGRCHPLVWQRWAWWRSRSTVAVASVLGTEPLNSFDALVRAAEDNPSYAVISAWEQFNGALNDLVGAIVPGWKKKLSPTRPVEWRHRRSLVGSHPCCRNPSLQRPSDPDPAYLA